MKGDMSQNGPKLDTSGPHVTKRDKWVAPTITPLGVTALGKNNTYPYERGMQGQGPS